VCEVIIIENLRSTNSGPQNPQFSPCPPDYTVTGWCKAFKIIDREHTKTTPNVLVPVDRMCTNFGNLAFVYTLSVFPTAFELRGVDLPGFSMQGKTFFEQKTIS
jgi:hypothetical protein